MWRLVVTLGVLGCDDGGLSGGRLSADTSADVSDGPVVDASVVDAGPGPDTALPDAGLDALLPDATAPLADAGPLDLAVPLPPKDAGPPDAALPPCPSAEPFDYACDLAVPESCPGGICLFGLCLGPVLDADRWAGCGDGACDRCEDAARCPVDCGEPPVFIGQKVYDPAVTMTVHVHGFSVVGEADFEAQVYGRTKGPGDIGGGVLAFAPGIPDGEVEPEAPNQLISVGYYGAVPADWLTPEQIAEVEALDHRTTDALRRYALIVGHFIRHRMALSGARHVNLLCHSMGCHVSRYLIEHDINRLASENVIVRWSTVAGVVAGARLAKLFDNPQVRQWAEALNLNTSDFVHMHPDHVMDVSARWDHRPHEANNPLFRGIAIHHLGATDPRVAATANLVRLLDLRNPADEPNDGIVHTADEHFHDQAEAVRFPTTDGRTLRPTLTTLHFDHELVKEDPGTGIIHAAALFHRRKVLISLREVELFNDLERDDGLDFENEGPPPAELAAEVAVRFDPYVRDTYGVEANVHHQLIEHRAPEVVRLAQGEVVDVNLPLFAGPVFDDMQALFLDLELLEVDNYNRFGVQESLFDPHERLALFRDQVALADQEILIENEMLRAVVQVEVFTLY